MSASPEDVPEACRRTCQERAKSVTESVPRSTGPTEPTWTRRGTTHRADADGTGAESRGPRAPAVAGAGGDADRPRDRAGRRPADAVRALGVHRAVVAPRRPGTRPVH